MGKLAITGGEPVRKKRFDPWPVYTEGEKCAEFHTAQYGQCVNTGTVAIQAALKAVGIQPGDEVLVPAYTWEGTVGPVLLVNAVPVFVDVDPDTYCIDAKLIEQLITPKT